jgi:uncharacterized protein (DUF427 family)
MARSVRIIHKRTGMLLAEGALGWGITPFEGNYYVSRDFLRTDRFKPTFVPGLCPYKFLYVWLDLVLDDGTREKNLGWLYWLPNPILPFIWFRVALPGFHPAIIVERDGAGTWKNRDFDRLGRSDLTNGAT